MAALFLFYNAEVNMLYTLYFVFAILALGCIFFDEDDWRK